MATFTAVENDPFKEESSPQGRGFTPVEHDPFKDFIPELPKPSYLEAAKTGFKEGLAGAARLYEIPAKLMYPESEYGKIHLSHLLEPSEEEIRRTQELGIPGQVVRGAAGIPGAFLKYGPLTHLLGPVAGFALPETLEAISEKKPLPEVAKRTAEGLVMGAGFKYLPSGLRWRVPGMAALFGGQALYETGEPKEAIAPAIVGAGMGLMGGRGKRMPLRPEAEPRPTEPLRIPEIPESRYMMGTPGWPRPEELPYPPVPYRRGGPMVDTGEFFGYETAPPRPERGRLPYFRGLPRPGEEHYGPIEMGPLPREPAWPYLPTVYEPRPPAEPISRPDIVFKAPHVNEIFELRDVVARGEPGRKIGAEGGETISWGSSYPPFMRNQGWTKVEVLKAVDNGLAGRKGFGKRQQKIWDAVNEEGKGIYNDRLEEQKRIEERKVVLDKDPDFLKKETIDDLTKNLDNEIIGLKEEWREQGYPESEINGLVDQAYKTVKTEGIPTEAEGIKEILTKPTEELAPDTRPLPDWAREEMLRRGLDPNRPLNEVDIRNPSVIEAIKSDPTLTPEQKDNLLRTGSPSPTRKGETLLPGMKVGLQMPSKGIEKPPTLEGTPLMEAARKAEVERVQPALPLAEAKVPKEALPVIEEGVKRGSLADFQANPGKFIPDDLMVDVRAIREKTGKEVTIKQNAKEAFSEITDKLKRFRDFWDCVRS